MVSLSRSKTFLTLIPTLGTYAWIYLISLANPSAPSETRYLAELIRSRHFLLHVYLRIYDLLLIFTELSGRQYPILETLGTWSIFVI